MTNVEILKIVCGEEFTERFKNYRNNTSIVVTTKQMLQIFTLIRDDERRFWKSGGGAKRETEISVPPSEQLSSERISCRYIPYNCIVVATPPTVQEKK